MIDFFLRILIFKFFFSSFVLSKIFTVSFGHAGGTEVLERPLQELSSRTCSRYNSIFCNEFAGNESLFATATRYKNYVFEPYPASRYRFNNIL